MAWLSDSTGSPSTRFAHGGPYVLSDGTVLAANWAELIGGTLRHAINLTPLGGMPTGGTGCADILGSMGVWSDTLEAGTLWNTGGHCSNWTSATGTFTGWGSWNATKNWSLACNGGDAPETACGSKSALFCFQQ